MPALKKAERKPLMEEKKRFPTEKLLKSNYLSKYQPDFAKVILSEPVYSIAEAVAILEKKLKGGS